MSPNVLADDERLFVAGARVGRLATSTAEGRPHVIPVCFELVGEDIYIGLDAKPKSVDLLKLRRVRNITSNPQAAFIVDRYSEDWSQLGYVLVTVDAVLVRDEVERSDATQALRRKYAQYQALLPADAPVIRLRPQRVTSWGCLDALGTESVSGSGSIRANERSSGRKRPHDGGRVVVGITNARLILLLVSAILLVCLSCGEADEGNASNANLRRGIELQEDGHIEQAFEAFDSAIESDPRNAEAYARRAYVYIVFDDFTSAAADLRLANKLDPELPVTSLHRGMIFDALDNHDEAILEYTRAIELEPGMTDAHVSRASVYLEIGDAESALDDLRTAGRLEPENAELLLVRGQVYLLIGDLGRAESDLRQVLELSDDERLVTAARQILSAMP